jgi:hypothetical protein
MDAAGHNPTVPAVLIPDDHNLGMVLCSLACLSSIIPGQNASSWILESRKNGVHSLMLSKIYIFRKTLEFDFEHIDGNFVDHVNEIYSSSCATGETPLSLNRAPKKPDDLYIILASLEAQDFDLGPINRQRVTTTELAIIIGFSLARRKQHVVASIPPDYLLHLGTVIVRGLRQDGPLSSDALSLYETLPMHHYAEKATNVEVNWTSTHGGNAEHPQIDLRTLLGRTLEVMNELSLNQQEIVKRLIALETWAKSG